jgi:hypothetical protein
MSNVMFCLVKSRGKKPLKIYYFFIDLKITMFKHSQDQFVFLLLMCCVVLLFSKENNLKWELGDQIFDPVLQSSNYLFGPLYHIAASSIVLD